MSSMEINELRIGNIIDVFGECKVVAINADKKKKKIKVRRQGDSEGHTLTEWAPIDSFDVCPILLTEDWLLRFGFYGRDTDCEIFSIDNWIDLIKEYSVEKPNCYDFYCRGAYLTCLQYLHQLQNLYLALSGEELTLKQE